MSASVPELVTAVIATYNMGRYLPEAVASVLGQVYPHVEVQIVDDGSTDDTRSIVAQLCRDPRVRVHHQPNRGQARAKNQGIALSRGAFVAFLDADDLWLPDKLQLQMQLFAGRPNVGVVYSEVEHMDAHGQLIPKRPGHFHRGNVCGQLLVDNFINFPTAVVRKECLERWGAFDESYDMGIDYDLWLRLAAHCEFDYISTPTARYRIWAGQMSKNYRRRYESAIRIMTNFLAKHPDAVAPEFVRTAWAQIYVGRGNHILWNERDRAAALSDYWRALQRYPVYWQAWRAILRSLITARAPRAG